MPEFSNISHVPGIFLYVAHNAATSGGISYPFTFIHVIEPRPCIFSDCTPPVRPSYKYAIIFNTPIFTVDGIVIVAAAVNLYLYAYTISP